MLIWKDRTEERLETMGTRLQVLERAWSSISKVEPPAKFTVNPRADFVELLRTRLNEEELKDWAFALKVDYESLAADGKSGKARELFLYMENLNRLYELTDLARDERPDVDWPIL